MGIAVGDIDGTPDGLRDGAAVGAVEGLREGDSVVGLHVGGLDGDNVGTEWRLVGELANISLQ